MITLSLLTVEYYPSLYDGKAINSKGEFVIMFGMLCLGGFMMPAITSVKAVREGMTPEKWKRIQQIGYGALLANIFHVFAIGSDGWIDSVNWYGYMPPITLIAAAITLVTILLKLYTFLLNKK
jgi:DMSO/TMAO reductase YedYZ heme-binding membrane subunit